MPIRIQHDPKRLENNAKIFEKTENVYKTMPNQIQHGCDQSPVNLLAMHVAERVRGE
jgi:hypothetical protein